MIRKAASVRFLTYSSGVVLQIGTVFLIVNLLDIYQFGVWGVANSLIYIFSTIGQLTYFQFIEKYFPKFDDIKKEMLFNKFIKTIFVITPFWLFLLLFLDYLSYFERFNANNLIYFYLLITALTFVESCINLFHAHFVAKQKSPLLDLNELILSKLLRFIIFYILLANNYSIYYLLLASLLIRSLFLLRLLSLENNDLINTIFKIFNSSIKEDNFQNFKYNFSAFLNSSLYVTFLNILFLISVNFSLNITVAHFSLAVLIINNLRPIFDSLSSLLSPVISKNITAKDDSYYLQALTLFVNTFIVAIVLNITIYLIESQYLLKYFLSDFDDGVYKIIFLAVFSSTIHSIYYSKYFEALFSDKEDKLIILTAGDTLFCIILYLILNNLFLNNFLYIYILFELILLIGVNYYYLRGRKTKKTLFNIAYSYILSMLFFFLILFDIHIGYFQFLILLTLIPDTINLFNYSKLSDFEMKNKFKY